MTLDCDVVLGVFVRHAPQYIRLGAISPHKKLWLWAHKTVVYDGINCRRGLLGGMESRVARATSASVLKLAESWCRRSPVCTDNLLGCGLKLKLRLTRFHIRYILKS